MSPTVTTGRVYHSNPIGSANRRVTPLHMPSADATELYREMSKDEARIELRSWKRYVDKYNEEYNRQLSLIQILKAEYEDKDAAKIVAIAVGDDASVPTAVTSGAAAQQGRLMTLLKIDPSSFEQLQLSESMYKSSIIKIYDFWKERVKVFSEQDA